MFCSFEQEQEDTFETTNESKEAGLRSEGLESGILSRVLEGHPHLAWLKVQRLLLAESRSIQTTQLKLAGLVFWIYKIYYTCTE